MNVEHLLTMANQIGQFYQAYPNRDDALKTAAMHVRRSWDPRMRRALLEHLDAHAGQGLDEFMLEAVRTHRAALTPAENAFPPAS
jgi:formate dehydrogenase subunit delta